MLPSHQQFIKNASSVKSESPKRVMDGMVSGSLSEFQLQAVDGILRSGMPSGLHSPVGMTPLTSKAKGHKVGQPAHKVSGKAPKTKLTDGHLPYPGSSKSV